MSYEDLLINPLHHSVIDGVIISYNIDEVDDPILFDYPETNNIMKNNDPVYPNWNKSSKLESKQYLVYIFKDKDTCVDIDFIDIDNPYLESLKTKNDSIIFGDRLVFLKNDDNNSNPLECAKNTYKGNLYLLSDTILISSGNRVFTSSALRSFLMSPILKYRDRLS